MPDELVKQYLVTRSAKWTVGQYSVVGYSVGGEETVVQIPEMNVCFDVGRAPQWSLNADYVCITHGHMDHVAGLGYYASQRMFQGLKPPVFLVPADLAGPIDRLMKAWRDFERQETPYTIVAMREGQLFEVRKDFGIRAVKTHHGQTSLGYTLISIREKLKPEYMDRSGEELARLKTEGVPIQYRLEVPLVCYLGDTAAGPVFDDPDVREAETLLTECTFFDAEHKSKSKLGRHMHVDRFVELVPKLNNKHIIVLHVTRRTSLRRARHLMKKALAPEQFERVHFLMDFDNAIAQGEGEEL